MDEQELKERMLRESGEFRRIHAEHQGYEQELAEIKLRNFLTEAEKLREKELKKKKLLLKDEMYRMMADFRKSV